MTSECDFETETNKLLWPVSQHHPRQCIPATYRFSSK